MTAENLDVTRVGEEIAVVEPARHDQMSATVTPYLPPAHWEERYSDHFAKNGEREACDRLYIKMKDSWRAWQIELNKSALWAHLGTFKFWLRAHLHDAVGIDSPQLSLDVLHNTYEEHLKDYNRRCLPRLSEATAGVPVPRIDAQLRELVATAADGLSNAVVSGGRFVYDRPELVLAGLAVGAVLVLAPEAAPILLAL